MTDADISPQGAPQAATTARRGMPHVLGTFGTTSGMQHQAVSTPSASAPTGESTPSWMIRP
jgi:hypothetical protein